MIRTTQLTVMPPDGSIFDVGTYTITIDDESGGEYLVIEEQQEGGSGKIRVDETTWPELRQAVDRMIEEIKA